MRKVYTPSGSVHTLTMRARRAPACEGCVGRSWSFLSTTARRSCSRCPATAALAVAHDCFGLMLVRQLAGGVPDEVFLAIAACSVVGTLGLLALYYPLCVRECARVLLGEV